MRCEGREAVKLRFVDDEGSGIKVPYTNYVAREHGSVDYVVHHKFFISTCTVSIKYSLSTPGSDTS